MMRDRCLQSCSEGNRCGLSASVDHVWHICPDPACPCHHAVAHVHWIEVVRPDQITNPRTVQHTTIGGKGHVARLMP